MGRFAKQRLTADEREERRKRRFDRQRQIKGTYIHREEIHGPFELVGDAALKRMLPLLRNGRASILVSGEQRHAAHVEKSGHHALWHVEQPIKSTDIMMGYVFRKPDMEGPLPEFNFNTGVDSAFICERLQKQPNLREYLQDVRMKVKLDAPVCFVVPLAHWEMVNDHLHLFTEGTLIYNLVLAGWNCRDAVVRKTPRHIEVTVRRVDIPDIESSKLEDIAIYTPYKSLHNFCQSDLGEAN